MHRNKLRVFKKGYQTTYDYNTREGQCFLAIKRSVIKFTIFKFSIRCYRMTSQHLANLWVFKSTLAMYYPFSEVLTRIQ